MVRIAHVTSGLDRHAAGVGVVVASLSAAQQSMGHEVRVFGLETQCWTDGDRAAWPGAPAQAFRVQGWPKSFGFAPTLLPELVRFDPDIVHLHGLWMYPAYAVSRWHTKTGKPFVYSPHGMLSPAALRYSRWKKWLASVLYQRAILNQAAYFHATSDMEAEAMRRYGLKRPLAVVPLGIAHTPTLPPNASRNRRALFLGRLHPHKGLGELLLAWAQLEIKFPDWQLDIVGPDEQGYKQKLASQIAHLKLKRVNLKAPLHGAERDKCMASAELFVLPSHGENFALTVAESLMMQTPVIVTNVTPWGELPKYNCGWCVELGVEPLVSALKEAMQLESEELFAMGRQGRDWMIRDFSWLAVAEKINGVYHKAHASNLL